MEKWEIELRKQLEKTESPVVSTEVIVTSESKNSNTLTFLIMLIFLGLAILFAYDQKTDGMLENWVVAKIMGDKEEESEQPCIELNANPFHNPPAIKSEDNDIVVIKKAIAKLEENNKSLNDNVNRIDQRMVLMGVLLNENFSIVRNNYDKSHLIFFNRDWTLDGMPRYIKFSDEDKEYLKKYIKN